VSLPAAAPDVAVDRADVLRSEFDGAPRQGVRDSLGVMTARDGDVVIRDRPGFADITRNAAVIAAYRSFVERPRNQMSRRCSSKSAFVTRREALSLSHHGRHQDGTLQAYHCPHCDLWHLGHRRPRHVPRG